MWAFEDVFYQIYPLGLCNAPKENDGKTVPRIRAILEWIPYLKGLGIGAIYFSPLWESDSHGYDARDLRVLDCRLGTNEDFKTICLELHKQGIKVVLDGVFHHVGRGFFAFQDVISKKQQSKYCDWFYLNFSGDSSYQDGFFYEGWEGHFDLVKLNLENAEVIHYLLGSVTFWIEEFQIDGLRLDVAYSLSDDFLILLRNHCNSLKEEFFLIGEMIHGDYNRLVQFNKLDSATNYECYKGLYSSFNSYNLFEIMHSLNRQFGPEEWTLYKGKHLLNFVDNHDVSRIATSLENKKNWKALYALLFAMPGIPCIYYGSEWGIEGRKEDGDAALRPTLDVPADNQWIVFIRTLIRAYKKEKCFVYGDFKTIMLTNRQCGFMRQLEDRIGLFLINIDDQPYYCKVPGNFKDAIELLEDKKWDLSGQICLAPNTAYCFSLIENN